MSAPWRYFASQTEKAQHLIARLKHDALGDSNAFAAPSNSTRKPCGELQTTCLSLVSALNLPSKPSKPSNQAKQPSQASQAKKICLPLKRKKREGRRKKKAERRKKRERGASGFQGVGARSQSYFTSDWEPPWDPPWYPPWQPMARPLSSEL